MPLVSIVMPTFNRAWIIQRAIRDVLGQTLSDGRIAVQYPFAVKHVDQMLCDYYFSPRTTAATITNSTYADEQLRAEFGLQQETGDALRIREKLERLVHERTERALLSPSSQE